MVSARGSIIRLNIVGERGQPCRLPLEILNVFDRNPEVCTCADGQEYRASIVARIGPSNPNLVSTISI